MNDEPHTGNEPHPGPPKPETRWRDEDHPGIDYQKKRAKLSGLWWGLLAVVGAVLVGLAILFGACALLSRF